MHVRRNLGIARHLGGEHSRVSHQIQGVKVDMTAVERVVPVVFIAGEVAVGFEVEVEICSVASEIHVGHASVEIGIEIYGLIVIFIVYCAFHVGRSSERCFGFEEVKAFARCRCLHRHLANSEVGHKGLDREVGGGHFKAVSVGVPQIVGVERKFAVEGAGIERSGHFHGIHKHAGAKGHRRNTDSGARFHHGVHDALYVEDLSAHVDVAAEVVR